MELPALVGSLPGHQYPFVHSGDIADRLYRGHGGHLSTEGILGALHPVGFLIEEAQIVVHERDQPDLLADLPYTDLGPTMSYLLRDHQGGVSAITSKSGTVDVDDSYSAFGQLRDSVTWSGNPTTSEINALSTYTRQGYSFQSWLGQSMGLNHMNGRVQDAVLGRFLSPDPFVPHESNAQDYNRYSYANNNPLTLVDPSGFDDTDGAGFVNGNDLGDFNIDPGPPPTLGAIASADYYTGSSIPGVAPIGEASCFGNCGGFYAAYLGGLSANSGFWTQVAGSGSEIHSNMNADGSLTPITDQDQPIQAGGFEVRAPAYQWVFAGGPNFATLGQMLRPYDPGRATAQFLLFTAGGGAGLGLKASFALTGAFCGAIGGGMASQWSVNGVMAGAGIGALTGGGGWALGDAVLAAGIPGFPGLGGVALSAATGAASGAISTASVNAMTGAPIGDHVASAAAIGGLAPLIGPEAMVAGGAGLGGSAALGLNALSGATGVAGTALVGP